VAVEDLAQDADGVLVGLRHADGTRAEFRAGWLVGCDGGHSKVRKLLRLPLVGESNQTWLLADARLETDLPRDSIYFIRTGGGTLMAVPLRTGDRWRLLDTVDIDTDGGPRVVADRFAAKLSKGLGRPVAVATPTWVSVFTAQQRLIEQMRVDRCLLAGDAAHVHSPASGQGLNTGLHEAYNLAWKLAMVVHGTASEYLLDSYSVERVPVGRALLASTERATDLVDLHHPFADLLLSVVMTAVRTIAPMRRKVQAKILSGISGLPLCYVDSPLTLTDGERQPRPWPGERLVRFGTEIAADELLRALRDPRWLLLLGADAADPVGDRHAAWLSTLRLAHGRLADALGLPGAGWILVRPDGYVSARGDRPGTLTATLARLPLVRVEDAAWTSG
jgi:hypothetical protein